MNNLIKKEILIDSFNHLKSDLLENSDSIGNIIEKLIKIDIDLSFELWKHVIKNVDLSHDYNTSLSYTRNLSYQFHRNYRGRHISEEIINDVNLLKKLYKDNIAPDFYIVGDLFNSKQLEKVNTILNYVYINTYQERYHNEPFAYYLEHLVYTRFENWDEQNLEFVLEWVEKLKLDSSKARIKVLLIDYL